MMLRNDGHEVMAAPGGKEALTKMEAGIFDLVLTDYYMPDMRGDELARTIKTAHAQVYIVLFSGAPPPVRPEQIDLMLCKPGSVRELRRAIATCP